MHKYDDTYRVYGGRLEDYSLDSAWNAHWILGALRDSVREEVEKFLAASPLPFDPQDLEHQALFYLTTINPSEIKSGDIKTAVVGQGAVILQRLDHIARQHDLRHLYRGLAGNAPDLNRTNRLKMRSENGVLQAVGEDGRCFSVEFRQVTDPEIISLYTRDLHYIHQERSSGETFGLFFVGDPYPWAVETVEPSRAARGYKKAALEAHGIDPDNAVELTRLYTLPGCPLNAISILDKLVARHYRERGVDAMFTRTMPSYSKSKSTTIAGGMTEVLCTKELRHYFVEVESATGKTWVASSKRYVEQHPEIIYRMTEPSFRLLPAVDVFMPLSRRCAKRVDRVPLGKTIHYTELPPRQERVVAPLRMRWPAIDTLFILGRHVIA